MDKNWKELWLQALKSGNYIQGKAFLRKNDKFCCLGVLCEITQPVLHMSTQLHPDGTFSYENYTWNLPPRVIQLTGIEQKDIMALAAINDKSDYFGGVINYIENYL